MSNFVSFAASLLHSAGVVWGHNIWQSAACVPPWWQPGSFELNRTFMRWMIALTRPSRSAPKRRALLVTGALVLAISQASVAMAHEFWLVPVTTPLTVGSVAHVGVRVGEFFQGESVGFSAPQTDALRLHTADGNVDLLPLLTLSGSMLELSVPLRKAGTTMVTFDSQPNLITLPADTFHAYLHDEGIDFIKAQRVAAGTSKKPGRERYRRYVKTLMQVQAAALTEPTAVPEPTFSRVVGQRLEIVPLNDPLALTPGGDLRVQLLFEGKPLAGALVKAWHRKQGQLLIVRASTAADGTATVTLPHPGAWMVSVVHMVPAVSVKDIDWDSLWANLSFGLADAVSAR